VEENIIFREIDCQKHAGSTGWQKTECRAIATVHMGKIKHSQNEQRE
jgi:hypothetical protein